MKIRWYHWLIYRLFRYFWNPILIDRPGMCEYLADCMKSYGECVELYSDGDGGVIP